MSVFGSVLWSGYKFASLGPKERRPQNPRKVPSAKTEVQEGKKTRPGLARTEPIILSPLPLDKTVTYLCTKEKDRKVYLLSNGNNCKVTK